MSDSPARDTIELEVTNYGPIAEAGIDLRPLTVFVGPSNTGKSWLAILIYALHRCFGGDTGPDHWRASRGSPALRDGGARKRLDGAVETFVKSQGLNLLLSGNSPDRKSIELPGPILDEVRSLFDARGRRLGDELSRCLGIDEARTLSRKGSGHGVRVVIRHRLSDGSASGDHVLTLGKRGALFKGSLPERLRISSDEFEEIVEQFFRRMGRSLLEAFSNGDDDSSFLARNVVEILEKAARKRLAGALRSPAFYLPADRTGIMHAHGAMISGIIGSTPMTGARAAARTPMLSGVLADFLQQIIEIDRMGTVDDHQVPEVGARIEEAILGGSVYIERSDLIGFPQFMYRPKGWRKGLSLTSASSMVSEIAPVVLYLRHVVRPGDALIIEEPESHLHPAMQVEFMRRIAALVRLGARVIVATHSEWVLEELANTVRRSALPEARRKEIAGTDVALSPGEVGAWLFRSQGGLKGSVVEEVKLDEHTGLYPTDHDAVGEALYNDSARIFNHGGRFG